MRHSKKYNLLPIFYLLGGILSISFAQPEFQHNDDLFFRDRISQVSADNIFKTKDYYNWGASIIKGPESKYHLFYSRWKKTFTFYGWLTHSEIAHAVSDNPAGPWHYVETVLMGAGKDKWDAITAHNPKIKFFNGKYYLYYISTNMGDREYDPAYLKEISRVGYNHPDWKTLRENQRTGVAVSSSLNGPWQRQSKALLHPDGPITTLTVNPAIAQGPDDRFYLIVKGDKPNETRFIRNQAIAISDSPSGPFIIQERPVIDDLDTEDMSLWYDDIRKQFYGVFHAHTYIGMVNSPDGLDWRKATEYCILPKKLILSEGSIIEPDRMERPFVYLENNEPVVLSVAIKKGNEAYTVFIPIRPKPEFPVPNSRQLAWQQAELGAVFHYDLHVFDGMKYNQRKNRVSPVEDYQIFNPGQLDTDQWIKTIKEAGFKFAILTATHETGFALFQSAVNPYSMRTLRFQNGEGDIVRDFVTSCRKYGIEPGIYLGIRWNSFFGVHDFQVNGEGSFRENRQKYYNQLVEGMLKEICTQYGPLFEIWFDGGADHPKNGVPDVLPIIQQYQPNCLFYHNSQLAEARWGGSESGTVPYPCWATFPNFYSHTGDTHSEHIQLLKHGDPKGSYWMPAMSDAPLRGFNGRHEWFWEPDDEDHIFPVDHLMEMYEKSVGRNSTLIVGLTPDPSGLLPLPDAERIRAWGKAIEQRYGKPILSGSGRGNELTLNLNKETEIDRVIIQEDIPRGERIRKYTLEAFLEGKWKKIGAGESIGHKRIQKFSPVRTSSVRLLINQSIATPIIKNFSVFQKRK